MKSKNSVYENFYEFVKLGEANGVGLRTIENETFDGRIIIIDGKPKKFFGNCCYLGLETDQRIKSGAIEAIEKHGFLLSSSRHYLSSQPNQELLTMIEKIFGQPSLLMPMTNIASAAIIRTRINHEDAIILDQQVHTSVKIASESAKLNGTHTITIPHNRMDILERRIVQLSEKHDKIWYLADGIYSMFGDTAPMEKLYALMDKYENLRVFIDDAHGMSWCGKNGAGSVYAQVDYFHQQLYLVTSLAKGYGVQGAVAVFPTERERDIVRATSPQHIFLSPLNNATLGGNIASAKIHLSDEINQLQSEIASHIKLFRETAKTLNIPLANPNCESPIFFIGTGSSELAVQFSQRLLAAGFYVNIASQPVVPKDRAGMRIVLTRHHTEQDIKELLYLVHELMNELLPKHELLVEHIAKAFEPYFA